MGLKTLVSREHWLVALAAVLGASSGALLVRSHVAACSCADQEWNLKLASTNEPDEGVWPKSAVLAIADHDAVNVNNGERYDSKERWDLQGR